MEQLLEEHTLNVCRNLPSCPSTLRLGTCSAVGRRQSRKLAAGGIVVGDFPLSVSVCLSSMRGGVLPMLVCV